MNARWQISGPSRNPLAQVLSLIIAAVLLGLAVVMGAVVITVLLALGAVVAITVAIRIWWLHRKLRRAVGESGADPAAPRVIEGDYIVVDEHDAKRGAPAETARTPRDDSQNRHRDAAD